METIGEKNYYTITEVHNMTGIYLMTLYKRARRPGVDVKRIGGVVHVSEDSFDILATEGQVGRPKINKNIDKEEAMN